MDASWGCFFAASQCDHHFLCNNWNNHITHLPRPVSSPLGLPGSPLRPLPLTATAPSVCPNCRVHLNLLSLINRTKKFHLHLNCTSDLQSALSIIYANNIPLTLVEPCILWQLLTPTQQDDLVTRKSSSNLTVPCDKLNSSGNVFTFLLLEKYNNSTWQQVKALFTENGFQSEFISSHETLAHVILKKSTLTLHIALVKERAHMHMIPAATWRRMASSHS